MQDLTTQQAADRLGISRRRVLALIKSGQLPATAKLEGGRAEWRIAERSLKLVQKTGTTFGGRRGPKK
jgi:excisionase family DNA binding protein